MKLIRLISPDEKIIELVAMLDSELEVNNGSEHDFYDQFNKLNAIKNFVLVEMDNAPAGCGAFKKFDDESVEIKRMYVHPSFRNKGIASAVLKEIETWAAESGFKKCILETGLKQLAAIALYRKHGYYKIPNFEPYTNAASSICFGKTVG